MQLNRLALDEHRLEGLNTQSVQGRGAIEQHRVLANHFLENVPDLRTLALDELLRRLDGGGKSAQLELPEYEGLEELERHFLGQATLMELQRRPHDDHGTA